MKKVISTVKSISISELVTRLLEGEAITVVYKAKSEQPYYAFLSKTSYGEYGFRHYTYLSKAMTYRSGNLTECLELAIKGGKETRAWPIEQGSTILQGADLVHSDFAEKFITAEVINWQELVKHGSWKECHQLGLLKTVGKDYILKDGDVIQIKI